MTGRLYVFIFLLIYSIINKLSPNTTNDKGQSLTEILKTSVNIINNAKNEPAKYIKSIFFENTAIAKKLIPTIPKNTGHNDTRFFQEVAFR
jgi:hypothetical protein